MEFPDDVLRLIREYSRPRMQFVKEYNAIMRKLEIKDWIDVKKRLFDKDADQVIHALTVYTDSFLCMEQLELKSVFYDEEYRELVEQRARRNILDRALRVLLVGEQKVAHYERWLIYESDDSDYE